MQLHTSRLLLREFLESDAADANRFEADEEAVRFAAHGVRSLEDSLQHIRGLHADARAQARKIFDFAVIEREGARLVGRCGVKLSEAERTEAMLWYVLARDAWGHGYAIEAARAVLGFGFEELRLHRIFVEVDARNRASLRVAEKLGLRREGHLIEATWNKGEWTDTVVYALLDREFRARMCRPLRAKELASRRG